MAHSACKHLFAPQGSWSFFLFSLGLVVLPLFLGCELCSWYLCEDTAADWVVVLRPSEQRRRCSPTHPVLVTYIALYW